MGTCVGADRVCGLGHCVDWWCKSVCVLLVSAIALGLCRSLLYACLVPHKWLPLRVGDYVG